MKRDDLPASHIDIIHHAIEVTGGDRQTDYGSAVEGMNRAARIVNAKRDLNLKGSDIAWVLASVKEARIAVSPTHYDSHLDIIPYVAIAHLCALHEQEE